LSHRWEACEYIQRLSNFRRLPLHVFEKLYPFPADDHKNARVRWR
jgi:hypothetical protein